MKDIKPGESVGMGILPNGGIVLIGPIRLKQEIKGDEIIIKWSENIEIISPVLNFKNKSK